MNEYSDPHYRWLGIPRQEQPADHYRLLGIERLELNADVIANSAQRQLDHLKGCSGGGDRQCADTLCQELIRVRDCLLDQASHRRYAAQLQGVDSQPADLAAKADWQAFVAEFDQAWRAAQNLEFDPQHHWLGIPRHQRPASNFRLLGLSDGERHADVIRAAAERQIAFVRKFAFGEQSEAANDLLRQLSRARGAILRSVKAEDRDHAQPQVSSPAANPLPHRSEEGPVSTVPQPDRTEMEANASEVPAPMTPQPTPALYPVAPQRQPRWKSATFASSVLAATLIGLVLGVAGYIGHRHRSADRDPQLAQATGGRLEAEPEQESSAQHDPTNLSQPAVIQPEQTTPTQMQTDSGSLLAVGRSDRDSDESIENEQTAAALEQLAALSNQMHEIQNRIDQQTATDEDSRAVLDVIQRLGRLPAQFPQSRSTVDRQTHTLKSSAMQMLRGWQNPAYRQTTSDQTRTEPSEPPSDVLEAESMPSAQPPSVEPPPPALEEQPQPSSQRPEFFTKARDWTFEQGNSFSAIVVDIEDGSVIFRSAENGREATIPLEQLKPADTLTLRRAFFGDHDNKQWKLIRPYADRIASAPLAAADVLKQSHNGSRSSPYAGLWASVCMNTAENRHAEAASMLRQVLSRIETQRKVDTGRHAMTLASALNNLAVCTIKNHHGDKAAGYFATSLETMPVESKIILHNARQLQQFSMEPGNPLSLRSSSRRNLDQALKQHSVGGESLPAGWYYSLDVDLPQYGVASKSGGTRYLNQDSAAAAVVSSQRIRDPWCIHCKGLGSLPCKYGKCNRGTIVVQRQVQVAVNPINGEPIYGNKGFKQSCPNCSGRGSFDCPHCDAGRL